MTSYLNASKEITFSVLAALMRVGDKYSAHDLLHECMPHFRQMRPICLRSVKSAGRRLSVRPMHPLGWSSFSGCIGRRRCNRQRRAHFSVSTYFITLASYATDLSLSHTSYTLLTTLLSPNFSAPIFSICLAHSQGQQQYKKLQEPAGIVSPALQERSERRGDTCKDASLRLPPQQARPPTLLDAESSAETRPTMRLIDIRLCLARLGCSMWKGLRRSVERRVLEPCCRPGPLRCSTCRIARRRVQRRVSSTSASASPAYAARRAEQQGASHRHPPPSRPPSRLPSVQNSEETNRMTRLIHFRLRPSLHRCKSMQDSEETRPTMHLFAIRLCPGPLRCSTCRLETRPTIRLIDIRLCLARLGYSTWRGARRRVE